MAFESLEAVFEGEYVEGFYFLSIALLLAFGTIQTTGSVLDTQKPVVTVVSCSMYPVLNVGDIVVVNGVEYEEIEKGDIIVYSTDEMPIPVVHRVVQKHDTYLETMGDNNKAQLEFEKHIEPEQIYGKKIFTVPRIGLVKILSMDIAGIGSRPLVIDNTPVCRERV